MFVYIQVLKNGGFIMKFNKSDLKFEYEYKWDKFEMEDHKISGEPDETPFNRTQGYEVLYLLNWFNFQTMQEMLKAENMIQTFMPVKVKSQEDVKKWIVHNWGNPEYKI